MSDFAPEMNTPVLDEVVRAHQQRTEYELLGAWRAGYSYVHVFKADSVPHRRLVPSNNTPDGWYAPARDYLYTYDLDGVSIEDIREATARKSEHQSTYEEN